MTDDQYRDIFLAKHYINERWAVPLFINALKEQIKPIKDYLEQGNTLLIPLLVESISESPIQLAMQKSYVHTGLKQAKWQYSQIKKQEVKSISFFYDKWQKLLTDFMLLFGGERITGITDTTKEQIRFLLAVTQDQNMTVYEAAKYILEQMNSRSFLFNRALIIARTETTTASNYAHTLANEDSDIQTEKKWVSTRDKRTRLSHLVANGQKVGNKEPFLIGAVEMQYPGDAKAPAKEVVNCRCVVRFVAVLDANGMPMPKEIVSQFIRA